ncbi:MAG: polyprenyl synthetase family protein [Pyrinomonadaceae bacterium]|nr:polyprenyl synthetase family protein [Pyrinomonadaceae bacterium]
MQKFFPTSAQLDLRLTARKIFGFIQSELAAVEVEFQRQAASNVQVIEYLGDYLRQSGGKRVRPALHILSNYAVGGDGSRPNVVKMATVMEFLHTATLVHDDIIDNADTRRNRASVNARFGNQTAVLMGDWLYMSAFETSLQERKLSILDILTRLTRKMTEGELIQLTLLGRANLTEKNYFDVLERKTAFLFSACCEIGAILGDANAEQQTALRDFGMNLGTAFQLADDVLDFTSDEETLGKAAGADLLEGKLTLPLILLLKKDAAREKDLKTVMYDGNYKKVSRESILDALDTHGTLEETRRRANFYAMEAQRNLQVLPASKYAQAMSEIASYIVNRES